MILTTDALVGGTIIVSLVAATSPLIVGHAKVAHEIRKDLVAEAIAARCNVSTFRDEDIQGNSMNLTMNATASGDCGVSGNTMTLSFTNGDTRIIQVDQNSEVYVVG